MLSSNSRLNQTDSHNDSGDGEMLSRGSPLPRSLMMVTALGTLWRSSLEILKLRISPRNSAF